MARILFQSIRSQGALLPADYLVKIVEGKADGVTPEAYHLPPGSRLRSEAYQVYERLLKYWARFQEARKEIPDDQDGEGVTNKEWTTHLLDELRWGRPNAGTGVVFNEREYKIKRFSGHVPLHLVGCNQPLDRRGSSTSIPHGMVQEFLNASDDHLWAIVTNGLQLRLLRDNPALSRMAFVEFDLEAMMEDPSLFPDFLIFWHLCHHSRLEHAVPEETWLEKWSQGAIQDGAPVLDKLRVGVEQAVVHLGKGFLEHRANEALRQKIRSQELSALEYYRQLLRIIYRLLFLFVSEDRKLLHSPDASEDARKTFDEFYSTRRLRELADSMRGTPHADLWHQLSLLFHAMGDPEGCPQLGLPALGSFLWRANPSSTPDLDGPRPASERSAVQISNKNLLSAIRSIAYLQDDRDKAYRPVDFRVLDTQAFGSVYESLLELHPYFDTNGGNFELRSSSGADRKQTGSYYTPDSLVQSLLDSALEPVLKKRLEGKSSEEQEKALLSMKVCDPSVGSGHFLISAAHRLAYRLSRITSGNTEPSPEGYQEALRKVAANCLYGVDLNPMAVELCKFTLWLESVEPGKPFAFLDHHIQCGNSLLGVTPKLLTEGIPDGAFKARLEGDEQTVCNELARRNRREREDRENRQSRFDFGKSDSQVNLSDEFFRLSSTENDSVSAVSQKEKIYNQLVGADEYQNAKLLADLWCSVFTWKKDHSEAARLCPTDDDFLRFENSPKSITAEVRAEVREITKQYNFFHWHLAFPEVFQLPEDGKPENEETGWNGGFDIILGNPPWEKNKIEEKEFFANYSPSISLEKDKAKRVRLINDLKKDNPKLHLAFKEKKLQTKKISNFYLKSALYPLTGRRDVNLYSLFTELSFNISAESSKIGLVIPSGITTDEAGKYFTGKLVEGDLLDKVLMFSDRSNVFKGVSKHFCLLTFGKMFTQNERKIVICSELIYENEVHNISNFSKINSDDIIVVNPNTKTLPILKDKAGAAILFNIYRKNKCLVYEGEKSHSPWAIHELRFPAMFDMTNDRIKHFKKHSDIPFSELSQSTSCVSYDGRRYLPLYEAKLFHHYDHRWASYSDMEGFPANSARDTSNVEKSNPQFFIRPQYWVDEKEIQKRQTDDLNWQIGLRQITNTGNIRTTIVTALPNVAFNNKVPLVQMPSLEPSIRLCWIAMASSFALDFLSRQKLGGLTFNQFYIKQLSFPLPSKFLDPCPWDMEKQLVSWFSNRVFRLIYTASDLSKLASDLNYSGPPFGWNLEERRQLICELNSAAFIVYGYSLDDVKIAMKSFKILNETDFSTHGYCRTQNTIISIYKEMVNGSYADSKIDNCIPHKEFTSIYL